MLLGPRRAQRAPGHQWRASGWSRAQEHAAGASVSPLWPRLTVRVEGKDVAPQDRSKRCEYTTKPKGASSAAKRSAQKDRRNLQLRTHNQDQTSRLRQQVQDASFASVLQGAKPTLSAIAGPVSTWEELLQQRGLTPIASILADYGITTWECLQHLDEDMFADLKSTGLKPYFERVLKKWIKELASDESRK